MEANYKFYFDYIYFRMTQAYFRWDGRTGGTAIVAIMMVQTLVVFDVFLFILRIFYDCNEINHFVFIKWGLIGMSFMFLIYNYQKYNGRYNKLRYYWKEETRRTRIGKGILVIISLILPWIPLILMGTLM
jgi:hypothetical protein